MRLNNYINESSLSRLRQNKVRNKILLSNFRKEGNYLKK